MLKISKVVFFACILFVSLPLFAQNNTNSPYTRYGYGELADRSFGAGRAMGGVGFGLRSSQQINPMNPASYSAIDSMTFIFDFGAAGQLSWFDDGLNKQNNINGNIEYIAMQFPVSKRLAVSLGILPYSYVGYDYGEVVTDTDAPYSNVYIGKGGLNDIYGGLSIEIWKRRLSVGANVGYLFGAMEHVGQLTLSSTQTTTTKIEKVKVRDLKLDFGVQYTHPLSATNSFTTGFAYTPGSKLNSTVYRSTSLGGRTIEADTLRNLAFELPNSYGLGFTYLKQNKLTLGADFLYEDWKNVLFMDEGDTFKNRFRIAGGAEYIPDYMGRSFFKRLRYRMGAHFSNAYQRVNSSLSGISDAGYKEYGASVGFGLPLIDNRSLLNLSFEYVKIKPEISTMINEQYFRFTVNYTFNERWFSKFKLD